MGEMIIGVKPVKIVTWWSGASDGKSWPVATRLERACGPLSANLRFKFVRYKRSIILGSDTYTYARLGDQAD